MILVTLVGFDVIVIFKISWCYIIPFGGKSISISLAHKTEVRKFIKVFTEIFVDTNFIAELKAHCIRGSEVIIDFFPG